MTIHHTAADGGIDIAARRHEIDAAHQGLRARIAGLTDDDARAAIALPGWTRGHVLIHFADLSRAFARQARCAVEGRTVEVYDGGRPTRDRRIEELHDRPVAWLRGQVDEGLGALEAAWAALGPGDWDLPCGYRASTLLATQLCWWRETALHTVDLSVGYGSQEWSTALATHVVHFLQPRLEPGVLLHAEDTGETWRTGDSAAPVVVRGAVRCLAAWISGRPHGTVPTVDGAAALPELRAWP